MHDDLEGIDVTNFYYRNLILKLNREIESKCVFLSDDADLADEDPFVGSKPPKRERTSYNDAIKSFLEDSKQIKQDKLELERAREARLAEESKMKNDLGRGTMAADKARMENDRKREETFANLMLEVLNTLKH